MALQAVNTEARLRTSVRFYAMPDPSALAVSVQNIGSQLGIPEIINTAAIVGIGALAAAKTTPSILSSVRNFSRDQKRTITRRYGLGANSFEPLQLIPGPIETKLTIERIILYKNDTLKSIFGFWGENLLSQQIPMLIVEYKDTPNAGSDDEKATILYTDCWMGTNPIEYDIDAEDLLVIQDREIEVGKMIVIDQTLGGLSSTATYAINIGKDIKLL